MISSNITIYYILRCSLTLLAHTNKETVLELSFTVHFHIIIKIVMSITIIAINIMSINIVIIR